MCWAAPPRFLCGLKHPSTGAYRLLVGARSWCQKVSLQESSSRWMLPDMSTTSVYEPKVGHSHPPSPQGTLQDQQVGPVNAPIKSLLFLGSWCTQECVPLFPPSCGTLAVKFCKPSKLSVPGAFPSPRPTGWRAWHGAQNSHSWGRVSVI